MRGLLVVNPRATTTSPRVVDVIVHAFSADIDLDVTVTTHRGHGFALGERARSEGMDVVVTLGGDGVVNEVTNGLLAEGPGPHVPMLATVPGGSANVFARSLGLPNDAVEATGQILEALREGRCRRIGVGRANDHWFVANAGLGLDAEIIAAMEQHRARGRAATPLRYVTTTLNAYFRGTDRRHPAHGALDLSGQPARESLPGRLIRHRPRRLLTAAIAGPCRTRCSRSAPAGPWNMGCPRRDGHVARPVGLPGRGQQAGGPADRR